MDWRKEWFEFEDVAYMDVARQAPIPRAAVKAAQAAIEWKKFPHLQPDSAQWELPNRIRAASAKLIGGKPEEIAVTTGASTGLTAVAYAFDWKPDDEVLIATGEFPAHFTTWKPLEAQGQLKVKIVHPRERFITADDFIAAMTPKTRLVSASLVRFNDASLLDAARVAKACHEHGAMFLLDASQSVGAMKMDVGELGADFLVSSGYKWMLGPYGTGFFWARLEHIERMRVPPYYWMALEGMESFSALSFDEPRPARGARRWDAAETGSMFNLRALDASLDFILSVGVETIEAHNRKLMQQMLDRLPKDRCAPASPADPAQRGPYACFSGRTPEKTAALFDALRKAGVIVSLREGAIRVAPHLFNTERDIDRLISAVTV
jgi:selenocysteine lyase/cysteine desulfurase